MTTPAPGTKSHQAMLTWRTAAERLDKSIDMLYSLASALAQSDQSVAAELLRGEIDHVAEAADLLNSGVSAVEAGDVGYFEDMSESYTTRLEELRERYANALDTIDQLKAQIAEKDAQIAADNDEILRLRDQVKNRDAVEWVEWSGGACPVSADTTVTVRLRDGTVTRHRADAFDWTHRKALERGDVVAYRVFA